MASGLNVNHKKSEILGINMEIQKVHDLANKYCCKVGNWPAVYLGLPFNGKPRSLQFWKPITEKVGKRLLSWKNTHITKGGRPTLIQATLSNFLRTISLYLKHWSRWPQP